MRLIFLLVFFLVGCSGNSEKEIIKFEREYKSANFLIPDACIDESTDKLDDLQKRYVFKYQIESFDVYLEAVPDVSKFVRLTTDSIDSKLAVINELNKIILTCHPDMRLIVNRDGVEWEKLKSLIQELESTQVTVHSLMFDEKEISIYVKSSEYEKRYK